METSYKNNAIKYFAFLCAGLLIGIFIGKIVFSQGGNDGPRLATFNGKAIYMKDVEAGMSEGERTGNSIEYKKQLAGNIIREKVIAELAAKENLSVQEFIKKIKSGAASAISDPELEKFLHEGGFVRAKLSKAQLENIKANMAEHKRELFFNEYMNKELSGAKITWDNP